MTTRSAPDARLRCTRCKRPIRAQHYLYVCDRGHELAVHRACREPYLHALLTPPPLQCRSGDGGTIVACRRSGVPDDPQAVALLKRSLTVLAREDAVHKILHSLESEGLIALHISFAFHQTWYDVVGARDAVEARVQAMIDVIDDDAVFKRSVLKAVRGWLVGG